MIEEAIEFDKRMRDTTGLSPGHAAIVKTLLEIADGLDERVEKIQRRGRKAEQVSTSGWQREARHLRQAIRIVRRWDVIERATRSD